MFRHVSNSEFYKPSTGKYLNPQTERKVVIITGGNQGIGFYTVLHLYLHGYSVYMLARNEAKTLQAIEEIKKEAQKRTDGYSSEEKSQRWMGDISYINCDLTSFASVEAAFDTFTGKETKLDLLVNNAGIMSVPLEITKDGYEIQYQVNVVSHMLLSLKLIPFLRKSQQPRIIHFSSIGNHLAGPHKPGVIINFRPHHLSDFSRYVDAKLAVIQLMKVFAKRYPDILCLSIHPGIIDSGLYDALLFGDSIFGPLIRTVFFKIALYPWSISLESGSSAGLKACMDQTLTAEKDSGKYLTYGGIAIKANKNAYDEQQLKTLWDWNIEQFKARGIDLVV